MIFMMLITTHLPNSFKIERSEQCPCERKSKCYVARLRSQNGTGGPSISCPNTLAFLLRSGNGFSIIQKVCTATGHVVRLVGSFRILPISAANEWMKAALTMVIIIIDGVALKMAEDAK